MALSEAIILAPVFFLIGLIQAYMVAFLYGGTGGRKKRILEPALNSAVPFVCAGFGLFVLTSFVPLPEAWGVPVSAAIGTVLLMGLARGMRVQLRLEGVLGPKGERRSLLWAVFNGIVCVVMFSQSVPVAGAA